MFSDEGCEIHYSVMLKTDVAKFKPSMSFLQNNSIRFSQSFQVIHGLSVQLARKRERYSGRDRRICTWTLEGMGNRGGIGSKRKVCPKHISCMHKTLSKKDKTLPFVEAVCWFLAAQP